MRNRVAVIAGDGIGPEVIEEAIPVLEAAVAASGADPLTFDRLPWSSRYYRENGRMMPADGLEQLDEYDAIYLGAIGSPEIPDQITVWGLMPIRQAFDQWGRADVRALKGESAVIGQKPHEHRPCDPRSDPRKRARIGTGELTHWP